MTPETSIKTAIKDYLNLKRVFWWYNLAGIGAYKGLPDIFAIHKGVIYGIEVKAPRGRLSDYQIDFGSRFGDAGGKFIVARSLDDVMAVIT